MEAYYGPYERPQVKAAVFAYIGQFADIQQIYDRLILEFSGQYRFVPDVAVIQRIVSGLNDEDSNGVYRHGRRIGHMDGGRFIPDLSLLSPQAFEKYALEYRFYENPQGYLQLLEDDKDTEQPRQIVEGRK